MRVVGVAESEILAALGEVALQRLFIFGSLNYFRARPICCVGVLLVRCLSSFGLSVPESQFPSYDPADSVFRF